MGIKVKNNNIGVITTCKKVQLVNKVCLVLSFIGKGITIRHKYVNSVAKKV